MNDQDRKKQKKKTENKVDEALEGSFPASDPPSWTHGQPRVKKNNDHQKE